MAYQYTKSKNKIFPDIAQVLRDIEISQAEAEAIRDPRPLISLMQRCAKYDARNKGNIKTRKVAVSSFDWEIVPMSNDPTEQEIIAAENAKIRLRHVINRWIEKHHIGALYGVNAMILRWTYVENLGMSPQVVEFIDPLRIEVWENVPYLLRQTGSKLERSPLYDQFQGNGVLITDITVDSVIDADLFPVVIAKSFANEATREWVNFNRRLKGLLHAKYDPDGASDQDEITARTALQEFVNNTFAVTSKYVEFAQNRMVEAAGSDSLSSFISQMDAASAIAILGQANTAELPDGGGSRAALQVMNMIRKDFHYDDIQRCETVLNEQLLIADAKLNISEGISSAPYKFRFNIEEERDAEAMARAISYLNEHYRVPPETVKKLTGIEVEETV